MPYLTGCNTQRWHNTSKCIYIEQFSGFLFSDTSPSTPSVRTFFNSITSILRYFFPLFIYFEKIRHYTIQTCI